MANFTSAEIKFMENIKISCQNQMELNGILASVIAAMAINESKWGNAKYVSTTNNLFRILVNETEDEWNGRCYSLDNGKVYESKDDCTSGDRLIRIYDSYVQCIEDHVTNLVTKRRSSGGPYKYRNIIGIKDYKTTIKNLIRDGYQADRLYDYKDPKYESVLISLIEKYGLSEWDNITDSTITATTYSVKTSAKGESLFTTTLLNNAEYVASGNQGYKVFSNESLISDPWIDEVSTMYRVLLEWDNPSSQIDATKILDDAKRSADSHTGYKVFDDDGNVIYNPWIKRTSTPSSGLSSVTIIIPGGAVELNNTPVYGIETATAPLMFLTGKFYYYDGKVINGRTRITKFTTDKVIGGKDPSKILGFINV